MDLEPEVRTGWKKGCGVLEPPASIWALGNFADRPFSGNPSRWDVLARWVVTGSQISICSVREDHCVDTCGRRRATDCCDVSWRDRGCGRGPGRKENRLQRGG